MNLGQWENPIYRNLALGVMALLFLLAFVLFPLGRRFPHMKAGWISIQSWFFAAPIILTLFGLKDPWPLVGLVAASILGTKEFFQITGMYHRVIFVWATYLGVMVLGGLIHLGKYELYALAPMVFLFLISMIPLVLNQTQNMLQFIALTLFNFAFIGWGFLHLGWILRFENGPIVVLVVFILSEFSDNAILAAGRFLGRIKVVDRISSRRTLEGIFLSLGLTLGLAYFFRSLLPATGGSWNWAVAGVVAFAGGGLGDLVLAVIRRDLGLKDVGVFILGRGGLLSLLDRAIFVGPMYYYAILILQHYGY